MAENSNPSWHSPRWYRKHPQAKKRQSVAEKPIPLFTNMHALWRKEFATFDGKRAKKELRGGAGIGLVGLFISVVSGLKLKDWREHRVVLIVLALLPSVLIVGDCAWRIMKFLRKLYRARPQGFKENVQIGFVYLAGIALSAAMLWYGDYIRSPHFKTTSMGIISSGYIRELPPPTAAVWFTELALQNSGVSSTTRNWRLRVKLNSGDVRFGSPLAGDQILTDTSGNEFRFKFYDSIYVRTARSPVTKEQGRNGYAVFVLPHFKQDWLEPGTILTVIYEDNKGQEYHFDYRVPPEGQAWGRP